MLIPNVHKTWAPVGETPLLWHSYRREKISVVSGLTVSPRRHRVGLYVRFHDHNITHVEILAFLRLLLRHLHGHVVLLWDGGKIHRHANVKAFVRRQGRLHVYRFPSYAPQLNPDEWVWTKAKGDLSNSSPKDIEELSGLLRRSIRRITRSQRLLWSCIEASELPWQ